MIRKETKMGFFGFEVFSMMHTNKNSFQKPLTETFVSVAGKTEEMIRKKMLMIRAL